MEVSTNNITLAQSVTYTLKDADKDSAVFDVTLTQSAKPQLIQGVQLQKMQMPARDQRSSTSHTSSPSTST